MRKINNIVIHCTATQPDAKVESIKKYWKEVMGWKQVGYHYIIDAAGTVHQLAEESAVTNGVSGHNKDSIHISYIGGIDKKGKAKDTRTEAQRKAMLLKVLDLKFRYPGVRVLGHRDFEGVRKECPSFDVAAWLKEEHVYS